MSGILLSWCLFKKSPAKPTQQTQQQEATQQQQNQQPQQAQQQNQWEFEDLTPFIKKDLTQEQKEKIFELLEKRGQIREQIQNIQMEEGNKKAKLIQIQKQREQIKQELMPYIAPEQLENFEKHCQNLWQQMQQKVLGEQKTQNNLPPVYSSGDVKIHNKPWEDCWTQINWALYDITPLFAQMPDQKDTLAQFCGKDASELYQQNYANNQQMMLEFEKNRLGIVK